MSLSTRNSRTSLNICDFPEPPEARVTTRAAAALQKELETQTKSAHRRTRKTRERRNIGKQKKTKPNGRRQRRHARNTGNCRAKPPCCKTTQKALRTHHAMLLQPRQKTLRAKPLEFSHENARRAKPQLFHEAPADPPETRRRCPNLALARAPC